MKKLFLCILVILTSKNIINMSQSEKIYFENISQEETLKEIENIKLLKKISKEKELEKINYLKSSISALIIEERDLNIPITINNNKDLLINQSLFFNDNLEIFKLLISKKVNVNIFNQYNQAPIFIAINQKNLSAIKILLQNGANINLRQNNSNTPIMQAIENVSKKFFDIKICDNQTDLEIIKLLLSYKPDLTLKNELGKTALDISKEKNTDTIFKLLKTN